MNRTEIIVVILITALVSVLIRTLITNPVFGERVNKIAGSLF